MEEKTEEEEEQQQDKGEDEEEDQEELWWNIHLDHICYRYRMQCKTLWYSAPFICLINTLKCATTDKIISTLDKEYMIQTRSTITLEGETQSRFHLF